MRVRNKSTVHFAKLLKTIADDAPPIALSAAGVNPNKGVFTTEDIEAGDVIFQGKFEFFYFIQMYTKKCLLGNIPIIRNGYFSQVSPQIDP